MDDISIHVLQRRRCSPGRTDCDIWRYLQNTYSWELIEALPPEALAAATDRNNTRVLRDVKVACSLRLAGDEPDSSLVAFRVAERIRDVAKRCHMHGVSGAFGHPTINAVG